MTTTKIEGQGQSFRDVLREENKRLAISNAHSNDAAAMIKSNPFADERRATSAASADRPVTGRIGLALSGGGIRSATFSLGVLQALADRNLLCRFDYLSTVSGGGYIGTWLSAWIRRTRVALEVAAKASAPPAGLLPRIPFAQAAVDRVEQSLARSANRALIEPPEVQWLRRYSNYLTPRVGALSTDALTVVAIWLRNLFLNALILVALTAAVLLLPVLGVPAIAWMIEPVSNDDYFGWVFSHTWLPMLVGLIGGAVAIGRVSTHLTLSSREAVKAYKSKLEPERVLTQIILPAFVAATFGSIWLVGTDFSKPGLSIQIVSWLLREPCPPCAWVPPWAHGFGSVYAVVALIVLAGIFGLYWQRALRLNRKAGGSDLIRPGDRLTYLLALIASVAVGVVALAFWASHWNVYVRHPYSSTFRNAAVVAPILSFAPPLMMFAFGIVGSLWVGFVGRSYQEPSREWWARMNGWHIFIGVAWLALVLLAFYVPPLVAYLHDQSKAWITAVAGTTWLGSLVGVFFGKNRKAQPDSSAGRWKDVALNVATAILAVGIFVALASAQGYILGAATDSSPLMGPALGQYIAQYMLRIDAVIGGGHGLGVLVTDLILIMVALLLAYRVDINKFSLHNMYKNRLTRCYLGASNADRCPQPFTGFDPADDIPLKDLGDQRPFHIINTAMNLVQGKELAWQQRKAASFVLTSASCGFDLSQQQGEEAVRDAARCAYRPTDQYASQDPGRENLGFSLGMAMATSGAAASPNMGFLSTPALAVIMTFFNVRLGRWSPNPIGDDWKRASPRFGLMYLLAELAGRANEELDFVYLSDGGHFENTAVYELIRRKCALILMVDSGADPGRTFADLANLQRKVRVDFGYEIDLPLDRLRNVDQSRLATAGFEIGTVRYSASESPGRIIVIKPTMCAPPNESADLQNYRAEHPDFPQQTTADQWFDESQFESYRKLGFELGRACLDEYGVHFVAAPTTAKLP